MSRRLRSRMNVQKATRFAIAINAVQIGAWRVTSAFPARVGVQTAQYAPRFRGFVTGESEDNEIETLYQIDFTPETANGEFRFRVERHD